MSTRCEVSIRESCYEVYHLYHHSDGYFEGVGKDLVEKLSELMTKDDNWPNAKELGEYLLLDDGYEITDCDHYDIDFYYAVDCVKKTIVGYPVKSSFFRKDSRTLGAGSDMLEMFGRKN